ncbi:hypothetical protein BRW65_22480 [Mycobacterium paraffinicum]|uniref:DUF2617 domain-containing protein n=1 Tax=Mycobacterium paraffinicum TaxID=53378 RepID=A0A1Q4HPD8_9MYCO|nr:DUF2617 family protein [Mycobacterium paraffinicum]OJZ69722.1 hypothetical protein BRW65_22480 [Mycobacterium paraffinicum]
MPLHQLAVTPCDVSGQRLGLALNAPAPPPLATCLLHHPGGGALLLGVLGASHIVTVEHAAGPFSEEVSCTARGLGVDLPERTAAPGYSLESRIDTYDEGTFRRLAHDLRDRCAREKGWLGGSFPGDDAALTALAAEPDAAGWRWRTWHLYPRGPVGSGGQVVHTTSRWRP